GWRPGRVWMMRESFDPHYDFSTLYLFSVTKLLSNLTQLIAKVGPQQPGRPIGPRRDDHTRKMLATSAHRS
ncbi:hypothetical protein ACO1KQ_14975, partial [Staphylococcus aureus]